MPFCVKRNGVFIILLYCHYYDKWASVKKKNHQGCRFTGNGKKEEETVEIKKSC